MKETLPTLTAGGDDVQQAAASGTAFRARAASGSADRACRAFQCGEVVPRQRPCPPQAACQDQRDAGQDAFHQFLQGRLRRLFSGRSFRAAAGSVRRKERKSWAKLIEYYLTNTPTLKALALLLDCRIPPQALDRDLADFARGHGIPLLPVLTKADKCTQVERSKRQQEWSRLLNGMMPLPVSSKDMRGVDALWSELRRFAGTGESVSEEEQELGKEGPFWRKALPSLPKIHPSNPKDFCNGRWWAGRQGG